GADDAPGLSGPNDEIVVRVVVAAVDAVFAVVGVTDRVLVIDLVAAAREDAAFVHLDDVADAFQHPLDAAVAARLAVAVVDGGDQNVLRLDRVGGLDGADFNPAGVRVEVLVVAETGLGVRADDIA